MQDTKRWKDDLLPIDAEWLNEAQDHVAPKKEPTPYAKIYGLDTPAVMLYRACMTCLAKYKRIPHTLYLHETLEPELKKEIEQNFKIPYTGAYYFHAHRFDSIQVKPHTDMPEGLADQLDWTFPQDMVVGLLSHR